MTTVELNSSYDKVELNSSNYSSATKLQQQMPADRSGTK
jgi:hypothetical protein